MVSSSIVDSKDNGVRFNTCMVQKIEKVRRDGDFRREAESPAKEEGRG